MSETFEVRQRVVDKESGEHGIVRAVQFEGVGSFGITMYRVEILDPLDEPIFRQYVADELERVDPADPPASGDEAWLAELRERIGEPPKPDASEATGQIIDALKESLAVMKEKLADDPPKRYRQQLERRMADTERALVSFAYDEYADIRRLLDALDTVTKERDAAVAALRELIDYATENADSDNFMAINQLVKIAKRGLNDDHE